MSASDLDALARSYVEGLDDGAAACLGDHHPWPQLRRRGGQLPKGITAAPDGVEGQRQGVYRIKVRCPSCGRVRSKLTLPNRVMDPGAKWTYEEGPKPPAGLGLTRAEYTAENNRRFTEGLKGLPSDG